MAVNQYFNHYTETVEQDLVEDLVIEAIQIRGMNMKYLPRTSTQYNYLFGEDPVVAFNSATEIEMFFNNVERFGGDGDIFSKFGYQINDTADISISKKRFGEEINTQVRPFEGDLIFMPITNAILEIKFVDHEDPFFQHGKQYVYRLKCELFEFNNESATTGDTEIDDIFTDLGLTDPATEVEDFGDNDELQTDADAVVQFDPTNPFGAR